MNAKTAAYVLNKIADLTDRRGRVPVAAVMTLVAKLEKDGRRQEAMRLNAKASKAFRNLARAIMIEGEPNFLALARVLRRVVADTLYAEDFSEDFSEDLLDEN